MASYGLGSYRGMVGKLARSDGAIELATALWHHPTTAFTLKRACA